MPDLNLQQALHDAVHDVLEKMFFIEPDDHLSPTGYPAAEGENTIAAKLKFEGPSSGCLTLLLSEAGARPMAADFLGLDIEELPAERIEEVVCELANMVCGSVLSRIDSHAIFRLASPRVLRGDPWRFLPEANRDREVYSVGIGSGALTVIVETREPVCSMTEEFVS